MEQNRRPIGYWLKHLDRLIEDTFERTLGTEAASLESEVGAWPWTRRRARLAS